MQGQVAAKQHPLRTKGLAQVNNVTNGPLHPANLHAHLRWSLKNYWGLNLADPPGERLLAAVQEAGLGLAVSVRLNDERVLPPPFYRSAVPSSQLEWLVHQWPALPIMLASATWAEVQAIRPAAIRDSRTIVEISYMKQPTHLVDQLGAAHVVCESGIPLHYPEVAAYRMAMADITAAERAAIWGGTLATTFALSIGDQAP